MSRRLVDAAIVETLRRGLGRDVARPIVSLVTVILLSYYRLTLRNQRVG